WVVGRVHIFVNYIVNMPVWRVIITLTFFVFYYLFFLFYNRLSNGINKETKFVGFGPNHFFEVILWNRLEIIGAVAAGAAVSARTPNAAAHHIKPAPTQVFRFQKKQMLE